jgi:hypothetical protein
MNLKNKKNPKSKKKNKIIDTVVIANILSKPSRSSEKVHL